MCSFIYQLAEFSFDTIALDILYFDLFMCEQIRPVIEGNHN